MNAYEEILSIMRSEGRKNNAAPIQIGVMTDAETCKIGKLKLSGDDMLITDWLKGGSGGQLKSGDRVAVSKVNDELYVILGRLV